MNSDKDKIGQPQQQENALESDDGNGLDSLNNSDEEDEGGMEEDRNDESFHPDEVEDDEDLSTEDQSMISRHKVKV
jgi:hypothetical protein